ncbi:MAG: ABC transporter ATP-binding protein [Euryarchaeota archaeon]|nr:ABC transporter ATP-binding protein [Euryarchaeota archaeon]
MSPEAAGPPAEARDLVKTYRGQAAVDHLSLRVSPGEIFALVGPNGAGKTTTVELLLGLRRATSGEMRVLGHPVSGPLPRPLRRRIGVLPQDFNAFDRLTVEENLRLFARMYGLPGPEPGLWATLGLEEHRERRYGGLSGGLKRRVGLAAAMVHDPELLFLDEPTANLDPRARRELWDHLRALQGRGRTILLTTNSMAEAEALAGRVALLVRGKPVAQGSPRELVARHGGPRLLILRDPRGTEKRIPVESPEALRRAMEALPGDGSTRELRSLEDPPAGGSTAELRNPTLEEVFLNLTGTPPEPPVPEAGEGRRRRRGPSRLRRLSPPSSGRRGQ